MSDITSADGVLHGPWRPGINWSIDEVGGIHDDATATKLGFKGGTVAGDVHMNQFVPVLLAAFGDEWLRSGWMSMNFQNATTHGESVRANVSHPQPGAPAPIWMEAEDGRQVMAGNAGLGDTSQSELNTRDLRLTPQDGLRLLRDVGPGFSLGEHDIFLGSELHVGRVDRGLIVAPIPAYTDPALWGALVGGPSAAIDLLWRLPTETLRPHVRGGAVGLFGAIEVVHLHGPILLDRQYHVSSRVVGCGQSPKTEYCWFDGVATNEAGIQVVAMRMQLRFMKATSPLYAE